jgi:hypothetical protein
MEPGGTWRIRYRYLANLKVTYISLQGTLTEGEGSVWLTSLYLLVYIKGLNYKNITDP